MSASFYTSDKDAVLNVGAISMSALITDDPAAYGLTAADATALATAVANWNAAYTAAAMTTTRSKSIVQGKNDARTALKQLISRLAKRIDSEPSVTDEMKLQLGLSVRKTPSRRSAPGTANTFAARLLANGSLEIGWKCKNPTGTSGTTYQVFRRVGMDGLPEFVGSTGVKQFVDDAIPTGATQLTYQVQATRSTGAGDWATFNVSFGAPGTSALKIEETPMKRAA